MEYLNFKYVKDIVLEIIVLVCKHQFLQKSTKLNSFLTVNFDKI